MTSSQPRRLLLHGFTGGASDWHPLTSRDPAALAIDLPGHGLEPAPVLPFRLMIEQLLATLPESVDEIIGYSLGGRIALSMIAAAPERFRTATIISAHPGLTTMQERTQRRIADRRWIELLNREGLATFVAAWEQLPLFATQRHLPEEVLHRQRHRRLRQNARGLAEVLTHLGLAEMPSTWSMLPRYPGRLRWIVGGADEKFVNLAHQVQVRRQDTELHVLPEIGHNPLLEAPDQLIEHLHP